MHCSILESIRLNLKFLVLHKGTRGQAVHIVAAQSSHPTLNALAYATKKNL